MSQFKAYLEIEKFDDVCNYGDRHTVRVYTMKYLHLVETNPMPSWIGYSGPTGLIFEDTQGRRYVGYGTEVYSGGSTYVSEDGHRFSSRLIRPAVDVNGNKL